MQETYSKAIQQILKDEGGYSDNPKDPGGPTNWGITIHDAQTYWKSDATAEDVKSMPLNVAEDIYLKHYATPVNYNSLPAGVDYAVLDYAVNSGVSRSLGVYNAVKTNDDVKTINAIYDERLKFLEGLKTWDTFGKGWTSRCTRGRALALSMVQTSPSPKLLGSGDLISNFFNTITKIFSKGKSNDVNS